MQIKTLATQVFPKEKNKKPVEKAIKLTVTGLVDVGINSRRCVSEKRPGWPCLLVLHLNYGLQKASTTEHYWIFTL